jgi:hypothetical protein
MDGKKMDGADPFDKVLRTLNNKHLRELWAISSLFSAIERFDGTISGQSFLFPLLNLDKLNMFDKAILASKAMDYKDGVLENDDFGNIMNWCLDTKDIDDKKDAETALGNKFIPKLFILLVNSQVRFQHTDFRERMGRAFAMLEHFPTVYREQLVSQYGQSFIDIPSALATKFGISPKCFFAFSWVIFAYYDRAQRETYRIPNEIKRREEECRKDEQKRIAVCYEIIKEIIRKLRRATQMLFLTPAITDDNHPVYSRTHFNGFLDISARTTGELREISQGDPIFSAGTFSNRLCALERYPVIKQADGSFIIPNLRYYETAIPNILHFTLQDMYPGNEYNEIMGTIQEYYINDLLSKRLPELLVVREKAYTRKRSEVKGPDFTILDSNRRLILVESKSKRFQARTRVLAEPEYIERDLERVIEAFRKLPQKYEDLFSNIPEYSQFRERFLQADRENPVFVVVVSGGIEMMPEILGEFIRKAKDNFLNDYQYPFCIIDLVDFEYAVEVAATGQKNLSDLLTDYWLSASGFFSGASQIQNLYGYTFDKRKTFSYHLGQTLFHEIDEQVGMKNY